MKKLLTLLLFAAFYGHAQRALTPEEDSLLAVQKIKTRIDYQLILDLLQIDSLRPGTNGMDPQVPNAANYDESRANPYPGLP